MREEIIKSFINFYSSSKSEFMTLTGPRRVGKTYLVNSFFSDKELIYITGLYKQPSRVQITNFINELSKHTNYKITKKHPWSSVFDILIEIIKNKKAKVVIFLDEISWMYTKGSEFLSQLGLFWNKFGVSCKNLKLIVCGSDSSFIKTHFIETKSEFNFRVTYPLNIEPFTLSETREFLLENKKKYSYENIFYIYSVFGGIPFYLEQIDEKISIDENIQKIVFSKGGILNKEFYWLISSILSSPGNYLNILEVISKNPNGLGVLDISKELGKTYGSSFLNKLIYLTECNFLIRVKSFYKGESKIKYKINHEFIDFYIRWKKVNDWKKQIGTHLYNTWRGFCYERIVYKHISYIVKILNCSPTNIYFPLIHKNKQYDMVIECKRTIYLVEVKFSNDKFFISKDYNFYLLSKIQELEDLTRGEVFLIMVTSNGLSDNENSKIVSNHISLSDFF